MINIMYLVLTAILALNVSAEILNAFKVVDDSLLKSNIAIDKSDKAIFASLAQKKEKAETKAKAEIWEPKALQAKKLADAIYSKIDGYKTELQKASGLNDKGEYKVDDLDAATRIFIDGGKGKEFYNSLDNFKKQILGISPEIDKEFSSKIPIDLNTPSSKTGEAKQSWEYSYFHMTPTIAAITILSKFQNDVKNTENQIVTYCHNQIGQVELIYDQAKPLVSQSSNYLMPGDKIKIRAGMGVFSSAAIPTVTIGGQNLSAAAGYAETELDAGSGGAHTIPVTIKYKDQNGKEQTAVDKVEYTVGTPGGAAASADKMNVFYIGVDNPLTVGSPTGWEKTGFNVNGGTYTGSNGKYIIKVSGGTEAIVNVTANEKTTPFKFRIKTIPDPIGMVGPSKGGRIQSNIFKAQDFLRAELLNFDFEARFNVVSATVYFAGAGFASGGGVQTGILSSGSLAPVKAKMDLCKPGSTVTFDDLKVVGPDGRTRTIPPISFVLF